MWRRNALSVVAVASLLFFAESCGKKAEETVFRSSFPRTATRVWIGPEYWANRLQDWRLESGQIVCVNTNARWKYRTLHLLTRRLGTGRDGFEMRVKLSVNPNWDAFSAGAAAGFLIGAGHGKLDYRAAALIHHSWGPLAGLLALYESPGRLVFRDMEREGYPILAQSESFDSPGSGAMELVLQAAPEASDFRLVLTARSVGSGQEVGRVELSGVAASRLVGNVALVAHPGEEWSVAQWQFEDWQVSGGKFESHPGDLCGPILSTLYTLSRGVLKLTAQMMPVGPEDPQTVSLQVRYNSEWRTVQEARIDTPSYTATFRVEGWNEEKDAAYRVVYSLPVAEGRVRQYTRGGIIRHSPVEKSEFVLAAFTGNRNTSLAEPGRWGGIDAGYFTYDRGIFFPHTEIVEHVKAHQPDLLFFSGDQIYEGGSPTAADVQHLFLDYLYKWFLWCWAYCDLTKDIPAVVIPDDHDVFHGNLWGCEGKATDPGLTGARAQDTGGYKYSARFVNMVQRTQTSHLPDPYDPKPVKRGIGVYFCELNYGGVSFAVLEDRKFKSAPKPLLPKAKVWNGWAQNRDFDPKKESDVPGAKLLGDRQLKFLEDWAADWSHGTWMKVVLSQTIFTNLATLPAGSKSDAVVPTLPILEPGEYPENDLPVADMDSDGWPPSGRNRALRRMRKAFASHVAGDQHLGSTIQYGIDNWRDAGYALCVPSVANAWPRRWFPKFPGKNRKPGAPRYTGDYEDGFGNKMTVIAVANPRKWGREPAVLYDLSPGYGIVRMNRETREITFENWPRWADPRKGGKPYPGWPVTFHQLDNYDGEIAGYLPTIEVEGLVDPVIQVIDQGSREIVYTVRAQGRSFRPKVFRPGTYTVRVGDPDLGKWKELRHLRILPAGSTERRVVRFEGGDR